MFVIARGLTRFRQRGRLRLVGQVALVLIVFGGALWSFTRAAAETDYDGDEGFYIWESRYFSYLFVKHHLTGPEWGDSYATHTQPMLAAYVIGAWLWTQGYDLEALPEYSYDWSKTLRQNVRDGRVPDAVLLGHARAPMVLIAAAAIVALYLLGRAIAGATAGLTAVALATTNELVREHLVQARSEALLAASILISLYLAVVALRRGGHGRLPYRWALALGATLGLGLASKLTAVLGLAAVGVCFLVVTVVAACQGPARRAQERWHSFHLFQTLVEDTRGLERLFPQDVVSDPLDRLQLVLRMSLITTAPPGMRRVPLIALLAAIGVGWLIWEARRRWRESGRLPAEALALLLTLAYSVGISASLSLAWARYFLPTLLLGTFLAGLGVSTVQRLLARTARGLLGATRPGGAS